jgi:amino acid efflux transporter
LAVFIIFGTVNAYTTGMSRVFYAVARDGGFPKALEHINSKTKVPDRVLIALLGGISIVLVVYYFFQVELETALLASSGAAILIYVVGSAAGLKILGRGRAVTTRDFVFPLISLLISLLIVPFVGPLLAASLGVIPIALVYLALFKRTRPRA